MKFKELLIVKLATLLKVNLLGLACRARGIGNSANFANNGEYFFLKYELPKIIEKKSSFIFLDIGQNIGDYTQDLLKLFPKSMVHGFEPNKALKTHLEDRFINMPNVILNNVALSSTHGTEQLFTYSNEVNSGHATLFKDVFRELHKSDNITSHEIQLNTLENYCKDSNIDTIDFLKIDVEGNEYEVLKGAGKMLSSIKVIQFEFNEMNIVSRIFLKDFYDLLPGYKFYRITPKGLFSLGSYSSSYEIFRIQNIVAVNSN